ncbi:MAG: transglycosylase SLT domain-containing protein [Pseudomonadota bacterium]
MLTAVLLVSPDAHAVSQKEELRTDSDFMVERVRFQQARRQLQTGKLDLFQANVDALNGYPIVQYLKYKHILRAMETNAGGNQERSVLQFVDEYHWSHLAGQLLARWRSTLFDRGDWQAYLNLSQHPLAGSDACRSKRAQLESGVIKPSAKLLESVWLDDPWTAEACLALADILVGQVAPSPTLVWNRIERIMQRGAWRSAEPMQRFLNQRDRATLALWIDAYRNPGDNADNPALKTDTRLNRVIVAQQHSRWSTYAAEAADTHWQTVRNRYAFSDSLRAKVDRDIALRTAHANLSVAAARLAALGEHDETTRAWTIRVALRNNRWQDVLHAIAQLPESERESSQWQYWQARALEMLGEGDQAKIAYRQLADHATYHGFLAADRLNVGYAIRDEAPALTLEMRSALVSNAEAIRAREYFLLGLRVDARRSWKRLTQNFNDEQLTAAATLASEWGWHDRAIFAIGKTPFNRNLSLRFPMPYDDKVIAVSKRNALEPAWVYGVMRRESGFIADIRSHAGAIGLMQLMPKTAQYVAKQMGRQVRIGDLIDEHVNISLGGHYLRYVLNKFDDHQVLATAAYNAGPNRVKSWLPDQSKLAADLWVDTIPFRETRRYVRAVLAYTTLFEWRMFQRVTRLSERMSQIASP